MIQFNRLRLNGFKSFVERTEMEIGPGLTGIVGPNGCGKSNLVEALRWSMGESSAKRMRGGGSSMEDVIFNGTEKRPARNMAEVSVLLDNSKRSVPAPYNDFDEIEVVRKIERDKGSSYRINGKNVRARDVQMLYADILSGANSPYLVSQGKISNIIQARPHERRGILEEAAGITGLYARRHEAELRLRATDNNLSRLEDLSGEMESRLQYLKKQARQAAKYRDLSTRIRELEKLIAALDYHMAFEALKKTETIFGEAEKRVAEHMVTVTQLNKTQTTQSQDLPDLRQKDAELAAALQTMKLNLQRLEDEGEQLDQNIKDSTDQLSQIERDRGHERETLEENKKLIERLDGEASGLHGKSEDAEKDLADKDEKRELLAVAVKELEGQYTSLKEDNAANHARKQSAEQKLEDDETRYNQLKERLVQLRALLDEKTKQKEHDSPATALKEDIVQMESEGSKLRETIARTQTLEQEAYEAIEKQRKIVQELQTQKSKIETEINTLESIINVKDQKNHTPILDQVKTDSGFETALSRALGDTLMGSEDEQADIVWNAITLSDLPPLPKEAVALSGHVKGPKVLQAALSQIGFVSDVSAAAKLSKELKPGQSLVCADGAYWRWDGYHMKASAADRHAEHLKQKNRLDDLSKDLPQAEKAIEAAQKKLDVCENDYQSIKAQLTDARQKLELNDNTLREKRSAYEAEQERLSDHRTELAKLEEALSLAEGDLKVLENQVKDDQAALEQFDDAALEAKQTEINAIQSKLETEKEKYQDALRDYEISRQDYTRRNARLQAIADERINLLNRNIRASEHLKELDSREEMLKQRIEELQKRPGHIKTDSEKLLTAIAEKETEKATVSDKLAVCENELGDTTKALKEAEGYLGQAREDRAHAQATADERGRHLNGTKLYIEEHFDLSPEKLMAEISVDFENPPALGDLKHEREKAVRDRDQIGPVNLRAEEEVTELESDLGGILHEKADLVEAVAELRQGIEKLNVEARERLNATFDLVNGHFREMFTRLFNGGKAHLALIESDDPLEAGLEIFAQPPGKALQSLTLLSGGEQTLTALALLFAMFLTNSAPICVLDEVDAPLDDANVDRVCDMLEEFAERGETRFLVITHHRLTMARVDRLYGVTMSEKGVSQLVSVDLNQQLDFLEAA